MIESWTSTLDGRASRRWGDENEWTSLGLDRGALRDRAEPLTT
jgi:hypothetical protein